MDSTSFTDVQRESEYPSEFSNNPSINHPIPSRHFRSEAFIYLYRMSWAILKLKCNLYNILGREKKVLHWTISLINVSTFMQNVSFI